MFRGFETEEDYLDSLKQDDSYRFSIPFEYIEKNYGNDNYDIAETIMDIDVEWDSYEHGYKVSYSCPDADRISTAEGNEDLEGIYTDLIEGEVFEKLDSMGITAEALIGGTGR